MPENPDPTTGKHFGVMAKAHGPICNLDCDYCYYLEKTEYFPEAESPPEYRMSDETLKEYIKQYIEASDEDPITFIWQGGEPTLLGIEFFERVLEFQDEYTPVDVEVQNSIQTNGTLLNEEWATFLKENEFFVGLSIDGPRELHDAYRTHNEGAPSFDDVFSGLELLKEYRIEFNVLCTVHQYNVEYPLEVYRFFKNHDIQWIQFIPIVAEDQSSSPNDNELRNTPQLLGEPTNPPTYEWARTVQEDNEGHSLSQREAVIEEAQDASVTPSTVDPVKYGNFLIAIFDEWVRNDIGEISVQQFDQAMRVWSGEEASLCVFNETCGDQVVIEHNGDVFSCDHFVDPGYNLGNVHEKHIETLVDSSQQQQFGEFKRDGRADYCDSCDVQFMCNGGCPKNWLLTSPEGDGGLNYLCPGYESFFNYIDPYMKLIAKTLDHGNSLISVRGQVREIDEYFDSK